MNAKMHAWIFEGMRSLGQVKGITLLLHMAIGGTLATNGNYSQMNLMAHQENELSIL